MALNTELRIFPDKELFAVDMAEILDTAVMFSGIIQGCNITLNSSLGTLNVGSGRILIRGRLGVVIDSGSLTAPTVSGSSAVTCYVVAVCNLSSSTTPFTIEIVTAATYEEYQERKSNTQSNFNTQDGFDFVLLGKVSVNPANQKITSWTRSADTGTKKNNMSVYNKFYSDLHAMDLALAERITTNAERIANNSDRITARTESINYLSTREATHYQTLNDRIDNTNTNVSNLSTRESNHYSALNDAINNKSVIFVTCDFGELSFNSSGAIESVKNVSDLMPSGYILASVIPCQTGTYCAYFYSCAVESAHVIRIQIMRAMSATVNAHPKVILVLTRNQ